MELSESRYVDAGESKKELVWIVPQPAWQPSDYVAACVASRQPAQKGGSPVVGALIVGIDQISNYTKSAIILRDNHTRLDATVFYAACDRPPSDSGNSSTPAPILPFPSARHDTVIESNALRRANGKKTSRHGAAWRTTKTVTDYIYATPTPDPNPKTTTSPYYIQWKTNDSSQDGKARVWTPLEGIAILMSGIAAWATLTPSVTKSTTNTTVFPTPIPGNPIPPGGVVTQSQTSNSKQTNASQLGAFATGFFGSSLTYTGQLTGVSTTDWQTYNAAYYVIKDLVAQMGCKVSSAPPPTPTPTPSAQPSAAPIPAATPSPSPCLQILKGQKVGQKS
jgi:hypothetical protein